MSSLEIAELTGKEHFHVLRDTRLMLAELGEDASRFGGMSTDKYGRPLPIFLLDKHLSITLVSGYSVEIRSRIIKRWMELEEGLRQESLQSVQPTLSMPKDYVSALRELAECRIMRRLSRPSLVLDGH